VWNLRATFILAFKNISILGGRKVAKGIKIADWEQAQEKFKCRVIYGRGMIIWNVFKRLDFIYGSMHFFLVNLFRKILE